MYVTPEQIAAANKASIESILNLATNQFTAFERLANLNANAVKSVFEDTLANTRALSGAKDVQEFVNLQSSFAQPAFEKAQSENLANVKTILGTPTDPRLPPGLDAALVADAYHEMDDVANPTQIVTLLRNIGESLKPQGRLGIVDWVPGSGGPGPPADQRIHADAAIRAANAAGLRLISKEEFPPFVLLLVFGRANARPSP